LQAHESQDVWIWAVAVAMAADLRHELLVRPRARLTVAGDPLCAPVYRAQAKAPVDWARVDVSLTDEGWLLPDDPDSRAHLVRSTLLQQHAGAARLEPLTHPGRRIEDAVAIANAHAQQASCLLVLTMDDSGRVASLFPGSRELGRALDSQQAYVAIDASGHPGVEDSPRRITLTPQGGSRTPHRLLVLRGVAQRDAFEQAMASDDARRWPLRAFLQDTGASPLQVHWTA